MSVTPTQQGSFRLFRFAGIDVFLHWSWFLIAWIEIDQRSKIYSSVVWNCLEYLSLFAIVLLHEFGHSLACRQVGGKAERIVLWPLGGVAYVAPPQRPGAMLWSIAAGPLVNVLLVPALTMGLLLGRAAGLPHSMPNAFALLSQVCFINYALLIFNMLPIYPLDGGQILRSLLWFPLGRARSLMIASIIGFIGVAALILLAVVTRSYWTGIMAVFILLNCWGGLMQARALAKAGRIPRRSGFACPVCGEAPPIGQLWGCGKCRTRFDTFETGAVCPNCGAAYDVTTCPLCGSSRPMQEWSGVRETAG